MTKKNPQKNPDRHQNFNHLLVRHAPPLEKKFHQNLFTIFKVMELTKIERPKNTTTFCASLRRLINVPVLQSPFVTFLRLAGHERSISSINRRDFHPTQRTQRMERNGTDVRNVTKWHHYWTGQSQPPATTAYRHTIKYEIKFDLNHKLHN